jgi:hypothetical protein
MIIYSKLQRDIMSILINKKRGLFEYQRKIILNTMQKMTS